MKKQTSLKNKLDNAAEFEIAEALISQGPRRLSNILRIVKNKQYAANRGYSYTTTRST